MPKTCSRISNCKITENLLYSGHKTPKIIKIYPLSLEKILKTLLIRAGRFPQALGSMEWGTPRLLRFAVP